MMLLFLIFLNSVSVSVSLTVYLAECGPKRQSTISKILLDMFDIVYLHSTCTLGSQGSLTSKTDYEMDDMDYANAIHTKVVFFFNPRFFNYKIRIHCMGQVVNGLIHKNQHKHNIFLFKVGYTYTNTT